jgi:two-component system response regulator AtoC
MDGLEVIRALRKADDPPRIVMVTGHASVTLAVDAMKAGSMDLLTKPVTLQSLRAAVDRALGRARRTPRPGLLPPARRPQASLDALVGDLTRHAGPARHDAHAFRPSSRLTTHRRRRS